MSWGGEVATPAISGNPPFRGACSPRTMHVKLGPGVTRRRTRPTPQPQTPNPSPLNRHDRTSLRPEPASHGQVVAEAEGAAAAACGPVLEEDGEADGGGVRADPERIGESVKDMKL